jgi:hypothetical protein
MQSKKQRQNSILSEPGPLVVFDSSHGQPNWSQTGFSSREMVTNFAGVMELLCRLGCVCATSASAPLSTSLSRTRLLVIPPPTGEYNRSRKCWNPRSDLLFTGGDIQDVLKFVQDGGRLLAFGYRFGDSFTRSNLRELFSPLGCLLNDDAVLDLQLLRATYPLDAYFDTPGNELPLQWSATGVTTVRWRTTATFTILPGANVVPLALSAGGNCISFDKNLRRISFSSLPVAVAGQNGRGRFALFGGPHVFETGTYGLLTSHDNARFLQNVLRWLLDDGPPGLQPRPTVHHALGTFFFNGRLEVEREVQAQRDQHTIAYVERILRQTGIIKALDRPYWLP